MNENKRTCKSSIRFRPDIGETADSLKREYGYSKADIFEMGVLLLDNASDISIIKNELITELIDNLSKIEVTIKNSVSESISHEITRLKSEKTEIQEDNGDVSYDNLDKVIESILYVISIHEDALKYGQSKVEPLGVEFYEFKSKQYGVPVSIILEKLEEKGYDEKRLIELNMNPTVKWRGYTKSGSDIFV